MDGQLRNARTVTSTLTRAGLFAVVLLGLFSYLWQQLTIVARRFVFSLLVEHRLGLPLLPPIVLSRVWVFARARPYVIGGAM